MHWIHFMASLCASVFFINEVTSQVTKMPSSQYMQEVDEMIEENRTKLEAVYMNNSIRLHNSVSKMKHQLNNTIKVSVDTLKDIASFIESAAEYVRAIKPNQTGSSEDFVIEKQNIVEFGNDTIQSAFQPHYAAAEKLLKNVSRLLKVIDINTNHARKINLEFCLTEKTKPLRISCLQSIMKSYLRHLVRVKNALKSYNEFNDSIQRKIDNVTRTAVIRTFQKAHNSSRTVVKDMFESSSISPETLTMHTQKKVTQFTKSIKSYISKTNEKIKLGESVYNNFNAEYENYKTIFDSLQNLALFAVDIIVYSKNVTAAELDYVKQGIANRSVDHFRKLTDFYKDVKSEFGSIREQINTIEQQLGLTKPVNVTCPVPQSGVADLFDCLHEKILYYSQMLNTTKNVYNNLKAVADNILENSDIYNRKVYDDFTLEVYNLTLGLIKNYHLGADEFISYEQTIAEKKYNDTLSEISKISEKFNEDYTNEIENKVTAVSIINDVIDSMVRSSPDDEKLLPANELLTEMNETIASQYETATDNIANRISNITEYSAEEKINDILATMSGGRLAGKCSIGNGSLNVVKVGHALQCIERERTNFNNSLTAVVNDYLTLTSELEEINALFLHDVQASLRVGIRNVMPLMDGKTTGERHPGYDVLICVNKIDIRKSNSSQLETDLNQCNSILAE